MKAHEATYGSFLGMLKVSIPVLTVITIIVIALVA
ncbi:aa3-type cytochrome c oxidase subunit IV [Novosphingobium sp. TH158]|nr:aa3-type cytochrome c oxidase subunit IV [Novosphingobium sp. TH158]